MVIEPLLLVFLGDSLQIVVAAILVELVIVENNVLPNVLQGRTVSKLQLSEVIHASLHHLLVDGLLSNDPLLLIMNHCFLIVNLPQTLQRFELLFVLLLMDLLLDFLQNNFLLSLGLQPVVKDSIGKEHFISFRYELRRQPYSAQSVVEQLLGVNVFFVLHFFNGLQLSLELLELLVLVLLFL